MVNPSDREKLALELLQNIRLSEGILIYQSLTTCTRTVCTRLRGLTF